MKPGGLLLFIDNAGGGFSQMITKVAQNNDFAIIFGPMQHIPYFEEAFRVSRFGFISCHSTTVTIILLRKKTICQPKRKPEENRKNNANEVTPLLHEQKKRKTSCLKQVPCVPKSAKSNSYPSSTSAENIIKPQRSIEENQRENKNLLWSSLIQSVDPNQLRMLAVEKGIMIQNSDLKSNPIVSGINFTAFNSLNNQQAASVENIPKPQKKAEENCEKNKNSRSSLVLPKINYEQLPKLELKQDKISRDKTEDLEKFKHMKQNKSNTIGAEAISKSPSSVSQKENVLCHQSKKVTKPSQNYSTSNRIVKNSELGVKGSVQKKSNLKTEHAQYSPANVISNSPPAVPRKENSSHQQNKKMAEPLGSYSVTNKRLQKLEESRAKCATQRKSNLGTEHEQCFQPVRNYSSYSSISSQPVARAGTTCEAKPSLRSETNTTGNEIDYSAVERCCPCCLPRPPSNLQQSRSNSPEKEVCCQSGCVIS